MLLPVLKPAGWEGLRHGARAHLWIGSPDRPVVVVAYARQEPGAEPEYVAAASAEAQDDALVRDAFNNLEHYETDFEVVEADEGRMLVSAGRPFAAERVLCQSHMMLAHEKLGAAEVLVSVTRRGTMLVCAGDDNDAVHHTMKKLHLESYAQAVIDGDQIFDHLVVVRDGVKVGILHAS